VALYASVIRSKTYPSARDEDAAQPGVIQFGRKGDHAFIIDGLAKLVESAAPKGWLTLGHQLAYPSGAVEIAACKVSRPR